MWGGGVLLGSGGIHSHVLMALNDICVIKL